MVQMQETATAAKDSVAAVIDSIRKISQPAYEQSGLLEFLSQNSIYIVMIIVMIVWIGIFSFLYNMERKIKRLEKEVLKNGVNNDEE